MSDKAPYAIVINNYGMGHGDFILTHKLVSTFLNMLDLDDRLPEAICLYADGVKLAVPGSPVLEELASLVEKGVRVIVCTTCLNFFDLYDELAVGEAGSMKDIVEVQWSAEKVVTL